VFPPALLALLALDRIFKALAIFLAERGSQHLELRA
jgi:hypothetical protein